MNEKPLITIVVPVYKVPYDLLHKCLNSICAQTSKNFEAILIDDGSPDRCGTICDEYAQKHSFMRVIHQANGGLSVVRNNGVNCAVGEWVCFVDGDDWIEPNTVEFAEQYVRECGDGDVLMWDEYIDMRGFAKPNSFFGADVKQTLCFEGGDCRRLIDRILPERGVSPAGAIAGLGTANARLYNRAFLQSHRLRNKPGLKRMQDNVFNLWVFHATRKVYYRPERLYHYVSNEDAATKRYTPDIADTMYFLFESFLEFIQATDNEYLLPRLYARFVRILMQCFELNYAHPKNANGLKQRLRDAARDMQRPYFHDIIYKVELKGQPLKLKLVVFLLRHGMYGATMLLSRAITATRSFRLAMRK